MRAAKTAVECTWVAKASDNMLKDRLREALTRRFRWWADLWRIHRLPAAEGARSQLAPAWGLGTDGALQRALSPFVIRAGGLLRGELLRVDVHPADLQHPRHVMALEWVLGRAGGRRQAVTYEELLAGRNGASAGSVRQTSARRGQPAL